MNLLITVDRVRELQLASGKYGELGGSEERDGCVEGAVGAAHNGALYRNENPAENPDPLQVAAFLLRYLTKDHCFKDGNKRAAWLSALDVLLCAGLTIRASQNEAAEFVERIADSRVSSAEDISDWLAERLVEASPPEGQPAVDRLAAWSSGVRSPSS